MKEQIQKPKEASRIIQREAKAANQAGWQQVLQKYAPKTAQRESLPDEDEELLQGKFEPNRTGLPDNLKTGVENLSGYSMDDVRVHYNSPKPAQLQALAYTQGTDIHVAPGQEKHLPHEAWHVVQQMQGKVQPTVQLQGVNVNDDAGLEKEADVMGGKAIIQRQAWVKSRPLGQQAAPPGQQPSTDWIARRLPFGNMKFNHRHIIFDAQQALPTGRYDNIGFHCTDGKISGTGGLFSENIAQFGYTKTEQLSNSLAEDNTLVTAIGNNSNPGNYNLFTHNCQDWVDEVKAGFNNQLRLTGWTKWVKSLIP
jgi:hypothetical protein